MSFKRQKLILYVYRLFLKATPVDVHKKTSLRVLQHFGTNDQEYTVVFTSGATEALKIVAQSFNYSEGDFVYLEESHTSVVGMREEVLQGSENGKVYCVSKRRLESHMTSLKGVEKGRRDELKENSQRPTTNNLCAIPAQCNFSGYKYPLTWIEEIQKGALESLIPPPTLNQKNSDSKFHFIDDLTSGRESEEPSVSDRLEHANRNWYIMLDAASFVATSHLDLSTWKPDFVALSFYKIFGYPTGLGALLIRNESAEVLEKRYFGGGTVNISIPSKPFHVKRGNIHERFEDGTVSFLSILALRHGFDILISLATSMLSISQRTFSLASYFYHNLKSMKYFNGMTVAEIYADSDYTELKSQGPVISFNLLQPDGNIIGYSEIEQIAYLHGIHMRYGCFCNPGACRRHLGLTSQEQLKHYESGHVCGDLLDIIDGKATGAIRVSIGYMTLKAHLDKLLAMIRQCWVLPFDARLKKSELSYQFSRNSLTASENSLYEISDTRLLRMFIYPIKSCGGFEVSGSWVVNKRGLSYDREWLIVDDKGVPLTVKREPRLTSICPKVDLGKRTLVLTCRDSKKECSVPLDPTESVLKSTDIQLCNSKVCGDNVTGTDCGELAAAWLDETLQHSGLRLFKKSENHPRIPRRGKEEISLSNQSQFLAVSLKSLQQLAKELVDNSQVDEFLGVSETDTSTEEQVVENLMARFRPNLILGSKFEKEQKFCFESQPIDQFAVGNIQLRNGGPCIRCATICVNPDSGSRGSEPLLTLSRKSGGRPTFGTHLYLTQPNSDSLVIDIIRIGDALHIN